MSDLKKLSAHEKVAVAAKANELAVATRAALPTLKQDSSRETLIRWMQSNDPNGCHTDELARNEDFEPYTHDGAWAALSVMLEGA